MRQRKVRNLDEKLNRVDLYYIRDARQMRGHWLEAFGDVNGRTPADPAQELLLTGRPARPQEPPLYLELGCGKGNFLLAHAAADPGGRYVGIEGQESVALRALEKLMDEPCRDCSGGKLENVRLAAEFVNDLDDYFEQEELRGIYLNFSDPWPKDRHAKRRLTHRNKLLRYEKVLKPGGFVEIKTDNDALFGFTLAEIAACGLRIKACSRDLHGPERFLMLAGGGASFECAESAEGNDQGGGARGAILRAAEFRTEYE